MSFSSGLIASSRRRLPPLEPPIWRIDITSNVGSANIEIAEVEFRGVHGGPSLPPTAGGSIVASDGWSETVRNAIFDGSPATSGIANASTVLPGWVGYSFPNSVAIVEAAVTIKASTLTAPKDFTFSYSTDGGFTWTIAHIVRSQVFWTANETRVFDLTTAETASDVEGDWHLNPMRVPPGWAVSDLGLTATNVSGVNNDPGFVHSIKPLVGARYFEVRLEARGAGTNSGYIGIVETAALTNYNTGHIGSLLRSYGYGEIGDVRTNGALLATEAAYGAVGDIVMVSYDPVALRVRFGLNGVWQTNSRAFTAGYQHYPAFGLRDLGDAARLIAKAENLIYPIPDGHGPLEG